MSYEDLKQSAAIICKHIAYPDRRILQATHDPPQTPEDSGWQFTCGVETHEEAEAAVWALREVAELDPTIRPILDSEPETSFERSTTDTPWRQIEYTNYDELT